MLFTHYEGKPQKHDLAHQISFKLKSVAGNSESESGFLNPGMLYF